MNRCRSSHLSSKPRQGLGSGGQGGWVGRARLALGGGGDRGQSLVGSGGSLWGTRHPPTEAQAQTLPSLGPPRCAQALGSTARPLLPEDTGGWPWAGTHPLLSLRLVLRKKREKSNFGTYNQELGKNYYSGSLLPPWGLRTNWGDQELALEGGGRRAGLAPNP